MCTLYPGKKNVIANFIEATMMVITIIIIANGDSGDNGNRKHFLSSPSFSGLIIRMGTK